MIGEQHSHAPAWTDPKKPGIYVNIYCCITREYSHPRVNVYLCLFGLIHARSQVHACSARAHARTRMYILFYGFMSFSINCIRSLAEHVFKEDFDFFLKVVCWNWNFNFTFCISVAFVLYVQMSYIFFHLAVFKLYFYYSKANGIGFANSRQWYKSIICNTPI